MVGIAGKPGNGFDAKHLAKDFQEIKAVRPLMLSWITKWMGGDGMRQSYATTTKIKINVYLG